MERTGSESYYDRRAAEYDRIYENPERQTDLALVASRLAETFTGLDVLEIAAGTGYWTDAFADVAASVLATDVNPSVLDIARRRRAWPEAVSFSEANAFVLDDVPGEFDAAFAGFLWSHVARSQLDGLLEGVARRVRPGSVLVFADNLYVDDSNRPIVRTDDEGNTYQARTLDDGSTWEVMKNFPSAQEIRTRLERVADDVSIVEFDYYWIAEALTPAS